MADLLQMNTQEQYELKQALEVQGMSATQRGAWLSAEWARVQVTAQLFMSRFPSQPGAMSFATLAEKNAYDERRELMQATQFSLASTSKYAPSPK